MTRLAIALACSAVIACAGRPSSDPNVTRAYDNPERVSIIGYDDAMEPFITRDGRYCDIDDGARFVLYHVTKR
ncbi:MAG: hypothetical protein JWL61_201 [Gemmatimonadetes bacterium]|nr:hypothetical protein [Gemmatimonadota bacterium]